MVMYGCLMCMAFDHMLVLRIILIIGSDPQNDVPHRPRRPIPAPQVPAVVYDRGL